MPAGFADSGAEQHGAAESVIRRVPASRFNREITVGVCQVKTDALRRIVSGEPVDLRGEGVGDGTVRQGEDDDRGPVRGGGLQRVVQPPGGIGQ